MKINWTVGSLRLNLSFSSTNLVGILHLTVPNFCGLKKFSDRIIGLKCGKQEYVMKGAKEMYKESF
jgi:hypothetical protein